MGELDGAAAGPTVGAGVSGGPVEGRTVRYGVVFCEFPPRRRAGGPGKDPGPVGAKASKPAGERAHGTYAKAVLESCACEGCLAARREYRRRRYAAITRPDEVWLPYVSAEPARTHLAELGQAGVGLKAVAKLSGVSNGALSKIVYGDAGRSRPPSRRIRPETLRRILAVKASDATGGQRVDAAPTWALLDELIGAGHTGADLARALGSGAVDPKLQIGRVMVRASTARAVHDLHRRLLARPGPTGQRR